MPIQFHDTPMDKLLSIHFPNDNNLAALHFDFQWESFHESTYSSSISSVPSVQGMSADLQAQVTIQPNSITTIPKGFNFWAYQQQKDVTERVIGGVITVVDIGTYYPEFAWKVGTTIQTALVTVSPYHGLILPLIIGSDPDIAPPGGFTPEGARAILANAQAHFDQDNGVNTFNAAWKLAGIISSHTEGGSAISTRIEFKQLYVFHLGRIKAASKNKSKTLNLTINLQGELSSELANYWTLELTTFKKPPKGQPFRIGPDEDFNAVAPFAIDVDNRLFHHEFSESNKPPFLVQFSIDLKTLKITGSSTG